MNQPFPILNPVRTGLLAAGFLFLAWGAFYGTTLWWEIGFWVFAFLTFLFVLATSLLAYYERRFAEQED